MITLGRECALTSRSPLSPMLEARIDGIAVAVSCRRLDGAGARRSERTLGRAREGVTISYLSREACVIATWWGCLLRPREVRRLGKGTFFQLHRLPRRAAAAAVSEGEKDSVRLSAPLKIQYKGARLP